jgi:hypothetical protein
MNNKKYRVGFANGPSGNKELYIETDDISELGNLPWVRDAISSKQQVEELMRAEAKIQQLEHANASLNRLAAEAQNSSYQTQQQMQQMQAQMQQMQAQLQQMPQQSQAIPQSQVPQPQQVPPRQAMKPSPISAPRKPLTQNFMQINPNDMSKEMYDELTDAQKGDWLKQWGLS